MKKLFFVLLIAMPVSLLAQEETPSPEEKLSIEFDYGYNSFAMKDLNRYYIDSFAVPVNLLEKGIKQGINGSLFLRYHLNSLLDLGLYGSFQAGKTSGTPVFSQINPSGQPFTYQVGSYELNTQALGIGISNSWHLGKLWHFAEKSSRFMQRSDFAAELNLGMAFTRSVSYLHDPFNDYTSKSLFTAQAFQGQVAVKYGYAFCKSPLLSRVGLKLGYQFLLSQILEDKSGKQWVVLSNHPMRLDFSGLFAGVYLEVGR